MQRFSWFMKKKQISIFFYCIRNYSSGKMNNFILDFSHVLLIIN